MFKDESNETFHISHCCLAGIDHDRSLYEVDSMTGANKNGSKRTAIRNDPDQPNQSDPIFEGFEYYA